MPEASLEQQIELKRWIARRLAHLTVAGDDEKSFFNAVDFLVQQTLLEKGPGGVKATRANLEAFFLLRFTKEEVAESLNRSLEQNLVRVENSVYSLDLQREINLKQLNNDTKHEETKIYATWSNEILSRYPELTQVQRDWLIDDLKVYLYKLFLQNGAECASLISVKRTNKTVEKSSEELLRALTPRTPELTAIREIEFPRFLKDADTERRAYFATLLDGTFVYQIIHSDPDTLKLVRNSLQNYTLYLDTNILYSLLGLRDSQQSSVIERSINLARPFGIKFVVSQKTLEEMRDSIVAQTQHLLKSSNVRRNLAEVGADISERESLTTAYWRAYAKTGISKEDFIERFKNLTDLLKTKQIIVVKDTFKPSPKVLQNEKKLLKSVAPTKGDDIAEHDAYHKLLIDHLRRSAEKSNSPERYWFLTWDNQLLPYAKKSLKKGEPSFVYLPHQLIQILRLYTQRTPEYDETFLELFTRPQLKSTKTILPNNFAEKVLTKISSFSDLSDELAVKIMLDSQFISTVSGKPEDDVNQEVENEVITRMGEQVRDLTVRVKDLEADKVKQNETNIKDNSAITQRDVTIGRLKLGLWIIAIICLILVNVIAFYLFSEKMSLNVRYAVIVLDIALIFLISKIKWPFSKTFNFLAGITSLISFVIFLGPSLSAKFPLPKENPEPSPADVPLATTTPDISTSSTPEVND